MGIPWRKAKQSPWVLDDYYSTVVRLSGGLLWWTWSGEGNFILFILFFLLIFPRGFLSKKPYDLLKPYHLAMKTLLSSSQLFFLKSDHGNKSLLLSYSRRKTRIKGQYNKNNKNNRERMLTQSGKSPPESRLQLPLGPNREALGPGKCCQDRHGR